MRSRNSSLFTEKSYVVATKATRAAGLRPDPSNCVGVKLNGLQKTACMGCSEKLPASQLTRYIDNVICQACEQRSKLYGVPRAMTKEQLARLREKAMAEVVFGKCETVGDFANMLMVTSTESGQRSLNEAIMQNWDAINGK